jgi:hypothetical protein
MQRRTALGLAALVVLAGACSSSGKVVALDGSPRHPDDEGVVTRISFQRITLDGKRTYDVSPELLAFSTVTRQLEPMLSREHQYVQVGLHGSTMVWMAGIAAVVPTTPPAVYYVGRMTSVDGEGRATFSDGTVLRLGPSARTLQRRRVRAKIDPVRHLVVELVPV